MPEGKKREDLIAGVHDANAKTVLAMAKARGPASAVAEGGQP